MVEERKQQYRNETKCLFKRDLAYEIVYSLRYEQDPPGRFLKYDEKDGAWHDVGDEESLKKTSQALRDAWRVVDDASSRVNSLMDVNNPLPYAKNEFAVPFDTVTEGSSSSL